MRKLLIVCLLFMECIIVASLIFTSMNTYQIHEELMDSNVKNDSINAKLDSIYQELISTNRYLYD